MILILLLLCSVSAQKIGLLTESSSTEDPIYENILELLDTTAPVKWLTYDRVDGTLKNMASTACEMLESGVSIVVHDGSSDDTVMFSGYFGMHGIPVVTVSATSSHVRRGRKDLITLSPGDSFQAKAIIQLLKHFNWLEVSVLASNDGYGINAIVDLQTAFLEDGDFKVKNILIFDTFHSTVNATDQLNTLKNSLDRVFVFFGSATHARAIFSEANKMGLMKDTFVWIVSDSIAANPIVLGYNGSYMSYYEGLIGVRPKIYRSPFYTDFKDTYAAKVPNSADHLTDYMLRTYDGISLVDSVLSTLDLPEQNVTCGGDVQKWSGGEMVFEAITDTEYTGVTGSFEFNEVGEVKGVAFDIVNFVENRFLPVGSWDTENGIDITSSLTFLGYHQSIPDGIANTLNGMHLRLGLLPEMPFISEPSSDCEDLSSPACYTGINMEIIELMADKLNFTYHYVMPLDNKFGGKNATTGEWNGLIKDLLDSRTDMIVVHLSNNAVRKQAIDFSYPIMDGGLGAFVKSDSEQRDVFFFLRPFDKTVWIAILVGFVLVTVVIYIFSRLSPFGVNGSVWYCRNSCTCQRCTSGETTKAPECQVDAMAKKNAGLDTRETFWLIGSGLVGKPGEKKPKSAAGRALLVFWWFFMLLMTTMYTANMTAFLTISYQVSDLTNIRELLGQDSYKWGVVDSRNPEMLLLSHIQSDYNMLGNQAVKLGSLEEGLDKVRDGGFVFIDEVPGLDYATSGDCNIVRVGEVFQNFELAFGLRKNSPFKDLVDTFLLETREKGIVDGLYKKYEQLKTSKPCSAGDSLTMHFTNLSGVFYTIPIGIAVGTLCLIAEYLYVGIKDADGKTSFIGAMWNRAKTQLFKKRENNDSKNEEKIAE